MKVNTNVGSDWLSWPFGTSRLRILFLLLETRFCDYSCEVFAIIIQSKVFLGVSLLAMNRIEVDESVIRIVIVLDSVDYWGTMFIVELYVSW